MPIGRPHRLTHLDHCEMLLLGPFFDFLLGTGCPLVPLVILPRLVRISPLPIEPSFWFYRFVHAPVCILRRVPVNALHS